MVQILVLDYRRTNTISGKDLQQQAVRNPSVKNMHAVHAVFDCTGAVAKLGQHAAADKAVLNQLLRLRRRDS